MILSIQFLNKNHNARGFTLIEMAIVLVILGLLLAGLITPLSSQRDISKRKEAERQLEEIRNALLGYAQVNGALPCPTDGTGNGVALKVGLNCTALAANSYIPYATLGIRGALDSGRRLQDPWGFPIRYRLTAVSTWQYANPTVPLTGAAAPNMRICSVSTCPGPQIIANNNVVSVVFSTGALGVPPVSLPRGPAETLNLSGGTDFVSATMDAVYDDIVVWISQSDLTYAMSKAR